MLGIIVPIMGISPLTSDKAAEALFTPVQRRVLGLLFGQPERRFQSAELIRLADSGTGAVHRQLKRLEKSGLVEAVRIGNQKHYQANRDLPFFEDLHGLILKTVGLVEPLRKALASLEEEIVAAFVFGSVAKGTAQARSDVDVMVISDDLAYPDVYEALSAAETTLSRSVNPTVMTLDRWKASSADHDSFAGRLAAQPKLFIVGSEDDLSR